MKQFGKIFKKFRESRGLKLKDISKPGISSSQLSRFEHGETDLTITKFMTALDEINMSIEEFMYAAHDFHRDELNELLEKVKHYVSNRDIIGLKNLLIFQIEKGAKQKNFHNLNTILIKIRLQDLSEESYYNKKDISYLIDYLFSVEYWGYYELLLFSNTLDVLPHQTFMLLSKEMIRRSDFYKEIPNNRRLISTMILNAFITCIERDELIDALYFEKQLNSCHFIETEIYERLVFKYAKSLFDLKKNNNQLSLLEMKKCIAAMKLSGSYKIAKTFEEHLKKVSNQRE